MGFVAAELFGLLRRGVGIGVVVEYGGFELFYGFVIVGEGLVGEVGYVKDELGVGF